MKKNMLKSGIALMFLILASVTCTEKSATAPDNDETVLVSGQVLAWYCYVDYPYGFQPSDLRYAVATGDRPQIRFLYPDGEVIGFKSDSLSGFSRRLPKGRAKAIIETRRTWPDTVDFEFTADTSVIFKIRYDVIDVDSIVVGFEYESKAESLGVAEEWKKIEMIAVDLEGKIVVGSIPDVSSRQDYESSTSLYVYYTVPLISGDYNIPLLIQRANQVLSGDIEHEFYPDGMHAWASDYYGCLQSPPNP
jgi:hypothetical protein